MTKDWRCERFYCETGWVQEGDHCTKMVCDEGYILIRDKCFPKCSSREKWDEKKKESVKRLSAI